MRASDAQYCDGALRWAWPGSRFFGRQGLTREHLAAVPPRRSCGVVMGFACDTLKRSRGVFPFGCQWVQSGRTAAYYGSVARIGVKPNTALAYQTGKVFAAGQVTTLGQLVTILDQRLQTQPGLQAAWCTLQTYHIIGNPLQSFLSTC